METLTSQQHDYQKYQTHLKRLGDEIEEIAKEMQAAGLCNAGKELHRLGDRIEHFGDDLEVSAIVEDSQSTVQSSQMSG